MKYLNLFSLIVLVIFGTSSYFTHLIKRSAAPGAGSDGIGPCMAAICPTTNGTGVITVFAGHDAIACLNTPGIALSGLVTGATSAGVWTTSGDGRFNEDAVEINAVYLPGKADIANGSVQLYLTSYDNKGHAPALDSLTIRFRPMPEVRAGIDRVTGVNDVIELNGWASDAISVSWSTDGAGTLENEHSLVASYQPAISDAGPLEFILEVYNGCGIVMDTMKVDVVPRNGSIAGQLPTRRPIAR